MKIKKVRTVRVQFEKLIKKRLFNMCIHVLICKIVKSRWRVGRHIKHAYSGTDFCE